MSDTWDIEIDEAAQRDFDSWMPEGSLDALQEVCLLHDVPLEINESGSEEGTAKLILACSAKCPECNRPVMLCEATDIQAQWRDPKEFMAEAREVLQKRLRQRVLLTYYRHIRTGWRVYDEFNRQLGEKIEEFRQLGEKI